MEHERHAGEGLRRVEAGAAVARQFGRGRCESHPVELPELIAAAGVAEQPLHVVRVAIHRQRNLPHHLREIASLARVHDYGLLWGGSTSPLLDEDASLKHAEEICHQFIERKISGVFFAPAELQPKQEGANFRLAAALREAGVTVVLIDRDITPFPRRSDFDLVGIDNLAAGNTIVEHLIKLGCRKTLFVCRPLSAATVNARIAGVREAPVQNGLEQDSHWVRQGDPRDLKFVRSIVSGKLVDAIICADDDTAAALVRTLESQGIRLPHVVHVAGFDDVKYAMLVSVPLTTIHQPRRDIAHVAFQTMLQRLAEPTLPVQSITLSRSLVVRESCGAYLQNPQPQAKSALQPAHDFRHGQRRAGGFRSAIVFPAEATHSGVGLLRKHKHAVNDRQLALNLNLRQRVGHSPADVFRVAGLALKNDSQANDGRVARLARPGLAGQRRGRRRNFKRARHAHHVHGPCPGRPQFRLRRRQHGIDVAPVVL